MRQEYVALYQGWREKAELFRRHGHEATARTYEACSAELEAALRDGDEQLLDLQEAARESGYSSDHLGRLVRDGKIPNAGRRHAPKIRRGDLPRRPEIVARQAHENDGARLVAGTSREASVSFERIAREALVSRRR
ncbi:MAG: hypothetical protein FJ207_13190 [Gemmatimonadetes bacterium]|nr:hypothetical protein [Gemmatimonadota bacterium]